MTDDNGTQEEATLLAVRPAALTLAQVADHLDVPKGYRVEIIRGRIVVSPTPVNRHTRIALALYRSLVDVAPSHLASYVTVTFDMPGTDERYIPDLAVVDDAAVPDDEWLFPASSLVLAAEITSPGNAHDDRVRELHGYAVAAVPFYLLIDTLDETITLFEEPHDGVYRRQMKVRIGDDLHLPEPFDVTIDTTSFAERKPGP
ncbi:Uma2 family endonuclease [Marinitenerispora sediminis]|nr:Uma2 family endonuclease [Marinitenerispora sediminis]